MECLLSSRCCILSLAWTAFTLLAVLSIHPGSAEAKEKKPKLDLPQGTKHESIMVSMRDGIRLATEVWLPPGEGPWPVVLCRTPYGRFGNEVRADEFVPQGFACVSQDMRGLFDSEGEFRLWRDSVNDGYDTVEWIAAQPWCNGRVGMIGNSAAACAAKHALLARPPHLVAIRTYEGVSSVDRYVAYMGGVYRAGLADTLMGSYLKNSPTGQKFDRWPRPRTRPFGKAERAASLAEHAADNNIAVSDVAGWFDCFKESALDDYMALSANGKYRLIVAPTAHVKQEALEFPPNADREPLMDELPGMKWLTGEVTADDVESGIVYYLMGDAKNPKAPGNVWKQTKTWPIPHTPTSYYMTAGGRLQVGAPQARGASLSYDYDPHRPVFTVGGPNIFIPTGPVDQRSAPDYPDWVKEWVLEVPVDERPLSEREDILRFYTEPLQEPVEVTGKVFVELYVSTDVPDTTFMAKLVDVYPDGHEALMLDSAVMARYWDGPDNPKPLEKDKVYKLSIDMWSTALVFDKGHKIGVHVTSSNYPRFEVHPNSFEPVDSYEGAPVAHNTVHLSTEHPSRLILPVIAPGVSQDYVP
ncbi:MAG: CocE/NonD family hydrolase [Planctomycetota bacterium]|jgi:predicted acyl esterase